MTVPKDAGPAHLQRAWEKELLAGHRWGRLHLWFKIDDPIVAEEHARLSGLYEAAQPLSESCEEVMKQVMSLEICNWNLEESILTLCAAIGEKEPAKISIGHSASITEERWKKIWAYYLALRSYLSNHMSGSYAALLRCCDPDQKVQQHVVGMLGEKDKLKELYVERFCMCLERWLSDCPLQDSAWMRAHRAAVAAIEREIRELDPEGKVVNPLVLRSDGDGRLNPCNHKAFRRYDMIISSIGAGRWCAVMPTRGTDGFERAETVERHLAPIESWIGAEGRGEDELSGRIQRLLGEPDDAKVFLASLLVSLLRAQQLCARRLAESRAR